MEDGRRRVRAYIPSDMRASFITDGPTGRHMLTKLERGSIEMGANGGKVGYLVNPILDICAITTRGYIFRKCTHLLVYPHLHPIRKCAGSILEVIRVWDFITCYKPVVWGARYP